MTRRSRGARRVRDRSTGSLAAPAPWFESVPPDDAPGPSLRERLERASVPARALLPIRFFFGATFVYAGMDKLLDPTFFDAGNPASIYGQLQAFTRVSPLAPLIGPAEAFALPIGLLIALAEIAIGLGALTGLAFRLAAVGGGALSFLFYLTASWSTHPYYYGPDLPYAFGWIALAIAGDAGLLVPRSVREIGETADDEWMPDLRGAGYSPRATRYAIEETSPARRQLLQAGVLGVAAMIVASLSVPIRLLRPASPDDSGKGVLAEPGSAGDPGTVGMAPTPATPTEPTGVGTTPAPATGTLTISSIGDVDQAGAKRFRIPSDPSGALPAGDPGIIVKLADGKYVAFDATCTHAGCRVGWDPQDGVLLCPCHGAAFDPSHHGEVLGGPTNTPLLELPLVVNRQAGTIGLKA